LVVFLLYLMMLTFHWEWRWSALALAGSSQFTWKTTEHSKLLRRIAAHESPRTTKLYDRMDDQLTLDEMEKISV